jgi:hypothetical protein
VRDHRSALIGKLFQRSVGFRVSDRQFGNWAVNNPLHLLRSEQLRCLQRIGASTAIIP